MRLTTALWVVILILLVTGTAQSDAVITVDPNTPGAATVTEAVIENDPRLSQKITYNGGYKRLHAVVDDLSQMTGVVIYSGLSSKNWQVRDIPMVVCVKDLPLGKVLRAIADAAHLRLSSRKIEDQGKVSWTYRLSRSVKEEMEIATLLEKRHESELAVSSWAWDALRECGKHPGMEGIERSTALISQLVASLGEDSKGKLLAYDTFRFRGDDPKYSDILREIYTIAWKDRSQDAVYRGKKPDQPTDAEMDATNLTIKLVDTSINCNLTPLTVKNKDDGWTQGHGWWTDLDSDARKLRDVKGLDLPPFPSEVSFPGREADMTNPDMSILSNDEHWSRPSLNKPFNLRKPVDKAPVFADLLQDLHKATDFNIICEDFTSHYKDDVQYMVPMQYKEGNMLRQALQTEGYKWFIDDTDNLLVGWADGAAWRSNHRNLVSEDYLLALKRKMDNEGVTIDDAAGFATLTEQQFGEWISSSRDLNMLDQGRTWDTAIWALYDRLKPEDKALAKSDAGLPLAKLDPQWISEAFLEQKRVKSNNVIEMGFDEGNEKRREDAANREEAMTDTGIIPNMVMRLVKTPATYRMVETTIEGRPGTTNGPVPEGLKLSSYILEIAFSNDQLERLRFEGPGLAFPVYSAKREAEILKEIKKENVH